MVTIRKVAEAFIKGTAASCHNATTDGTAYYLHGHKIVEKLGNGVYWFNWCDWYTRTTANHMNKVLSVIGADYRVSYAKDRDEGTDVFSYPYIASTKGE